MGGEDFTQENVAEMMQGWRSLNISDDLLGAWGYVPATDQSRFENGWWELQWESKAQADAAWAAWVEDQEAMAFMEANESVMDCFEKNEHHGISPFIEMLNPLDRCLKMAHSLLNFFHANSIAASPLMI